MPEQAHRNAYLVLAHEDVAMLNILAQRLVNTGFVYIHLDRLSKIQINDVAPHSKVKVTKLIKVNWGGYSIVEATRLLADQALADNSTRLTLLSGLSYPIVSDKKLNEFAVSDLEFVDAGEVDLTTQTKPFRRRFTTRHFSFHLKQNLAGRIIRRLSREFWSFVSKLEPIKELSPVKLTLGSQWWSVKSETYLKATELLQKQPSIERYFKKIECSDESYFGTAFHAVSPSHIEHGTTYVKWQGQGGPKALTIEDMARESEKGEFLFARKFRSTRIVPLHFTTKSIYFRLMGESELNRHKSCRNPISRFKVL